VAGCVGSRTGKVAAAAAAVPASRRLNEQDVERTETLTAARAAAAQSAFPVARDHDNTCVLCLGHAPVHY